MGCVEVLISSPSRVAWQRLLLAYGDADVDTSAAFNSAHSGVQPEVIEPLCSERRKMAIKWFPRLLSGTQLRYNSVTYEFRVPVPVARAGLAANGPGPG